MPREVQIEDSWYEVLEEEFQKPYFQGIKQFLRREKQLGKVVYPPGKLIFNAFNSTPFSKVKVVIIGQDPYHGPMQAMGLCFSVPKTIPTPPSLRNIYSELERDLQLAPPTHGDLSSWANHGVFMLNASLTVEKGRPGSHSKIGWHTFTNAVIKKISEEKDGIVFLLWGNFAKSKKDFIDEMKHYVLESKHPSPLAGKGFVGNGHFGRANEILLQQGKTPIDWKITD